MQDIRFRLDEGGVALQTEARLRGLCLPPRDLVCNRAFLVLLLRRGSAVPYLAAWIENDEILVPAPEPALLAEMHLEERLCGHAQKRARLAREDLAPPRAGSAVLEGDK
jgi:hypothetical protein